MAHPYPGNYVRSRGILRRTQHFSDSTPDFQDDVSSDENLQTVADEHFLRPDLRLRRVVNRLHSNHQISITIPPQNLDDDYSEPSAPSIHALSTVSLPPPDPRSPLLPPGLFPPRRSYSYTHHTHHSVEFRPRGIADYTYLFLEQSLEDTTIADMTKYAHYKNILARVPMGKFVVFVGRNSRLGVHELTSTLPRALQPGLAVNCCGELWGEWEVTSDYHIHKGRLYSLWVNHGTLQKTHVLVQKHQIRLKYTVAKHMGAFLRKIFRR
ncbi:hypothetical protein B0H11DRAFT_2233514 [Mycena galericulata]|nr:hypothetical protein B0H11DRAFT_2233514 [Mycena galericulata]